MATAEYAWPRRSSLTRSPDTLSPVYPDRPIRPLPKNRLRSRLSPEQSATLIYPPDPPISSLSFTTAYPFVGSEKDDRREVNGLGYDDRSHCTCGQEHIEESDEEEAAYDHPSFHRVQSPVEGLQQRRMLETPRSAGKPPPPASIASSADGYESFENTSNKKKRKIPLSGSSGVHQSSLTAELASMGISSHTTDAGANSIAGAGQDEAPAYSQNPYPSSTGMGHAGAGRGRASKASPIRRRDMRTSMSSPHANGNINGVVNGNVNTNGNGYPTGIEQTVERGGAYKGDGTKITSTSQQQHLSPPSPTPPPPAQEHKIISNAIANAQSSPITPQKGKENVSLLSQSSPRSATPKTQFTFTCESDSSNKMFWPGQGQPGATSTPSHHQQQQYTVAGASRSQTNHATQTALPLRGPGLPVAHPSVHQQQPQHHNPQMTPPVAGQAQQNGQQHPNQQQPQQQQQPRKSRPRRASREHALAARQRRLQQEYTNYHHKPTKDTMWICEFCEYEDIWGKPPMALIHSYEVKDRAERKKAEEKRRLLEKAKMKGRKSKKNAAKNQKNGVAQPGQQAQSLQDYHHQSAPGGQQYHSPDGPQDDYYDDDGYDDGYDPASPDEPDGGGGDTHGGAPDDRPNHRHQDYQYANGPPPPLPDKPRVPLHA